jgi:hypothetical protein
MIPVDGLETERLLASWRWLVPTTLTPLFISVFGDWVFGAPDGSMWSLSLLECRLEQIAANAAEYNQLKSSFEWLDRNFMASWQEIAHHHGLIPGESQSSAGRSLRSSVALWRRAI